MFLVLDINVKHTNVQVKEDCISNLKVYLVETGYVTEFTRFNNNVIKRKFGDFKTAINEIINKNYIDAGIPNSFTKYSLDNTLTAEENFEYLKEKSKETGTICYGNLNGLDIFSCMDNIPKTYAIYYGNRKFRIGYDTITSDDRNNLAGIIKHWAKSKNSWACDVRVEEREVKPKKKNKNKQNEKVFETVYIYTPKKLSIKFDVNGKGSC